MRIYSHLDSSAYSAQPVLDAFYTSAGGLMQPQMQPKVIRLRDAPFYLGMDINRFNKEVRLYVKEFPIGKTRHRNNAK